jgi:CRISPR associated protein
VSVTEEVEPSAPIARDVLLRVADDADRYAIHAALDERWGRRGSVGFLWCIGRVEDGPATRVRLPADHPDGDRGIPIFAPSGRTSLRFRLNANITHKIGTTGKRASWPREEIEPRLRWLAARASDNGFAVEQVQAEVGRAFIRKGKGFWIDDTRFTGTLTVIDAQRFAAGLISGIGQRSAFGFGLLETF